MTDQAAEVADAGRDLLALYDRDLPKVYGYLFVRCGNAAVAEELVAETFLAAVDAVRRDEPPPVSLPWVIGVARHKLADHWRRKARDERNLRAFSDYTPSEEDPWDVHLEAVRARQVLAGLAPQHQAALTLRYLDDLSVPEVATLMHRTVHATEALLVRARTAFRRVYEGEEGSDA
jgi:RNA polymerase sigma-70 factor (ECF subfamily)